MSGWRSDGRPLPVDLKAQLIRELDRLEVVLKQLKTVEAERDTLLKPGSNDAAFPAAMLARLRDISHDRDILTLGLHKNSAYQRF